MRELLPDLTVVIEGIAMDETPPCEILLGMPGHAVECGKPSVVRLRITMPCCGARYIRFVCDPCLHDLGDPRHEWLCEEGCATFSIPTWTVI